MTRRSALWFLVLALAVAIRADDGDDRIRRLAGKAGQARPMIRIGLADAHRIEVSSNRTYRILDPVSGDAVWRGAFEEAITVVADGGPRGEIQRVYRVQVGAYANRQAADEELKRLKRLTGATGIVHHDPDRGMWRVRLGEANDRLALTTLTEVLRDAGIDDSWITDEPARAVEGVTLRLVDETYDSHPTKLRRLAIVASKNGRISVDGRPYRGVVELRVSPYGTVRPVNWIELETYLRGVVPSELGPEVWPELQALQAQAVAARTYAWRNLGQFETEGFDLCDTPRCQVYDGAKAEHPLSDRAIAATRGEVLTWDGAPIVALYTATCGGHTENVEEVFTDQAEPYLKGVPCRAEGDALETLRGTVAGHAERPVVDETGADVTRAWSLLRVSGVLTDDLGDAEHALEPLTSEDLRTISTAMASRAGLPAPGGPPGPVAGLGQAAATLLSDLGWDDRAELLLTPEDLPALLRDPDADALPLVERRALGYLLTVEALRPFADGKLHVHRPPTRARIAQALVRVGETYNAFSLREGMVSGVGGASLRLVRGKGEVRRPISAGSYLFSRTGGRPVPTKQLELWPGDTVSYRTGENGAIDFLELLPPVKGVSDDRTSAVYSWEVRRTRRELEARINQRVSVGRLRDLEITRRGVSGRISELRVLGSSGSALVRGFDVRRLLDLRESLTVIELQRDDNGEIAAAVFAGKGWGHGVGLCQVGAYGMALRGAGYREILSHYYQGSSLTPVSRLAR